MKKKILSFLLASVLAFTMVVPSFAMETETVSEAEEVHASKVDNSLFNGAQELNGHYYKVFVRNYTWRQAQMFCSKIGGHLATVTSAEENEFVMNLAATTNAGEVFLGASDAAAEGTWKWVTGEEWSYTNWKSGQPGNSNDDREGTGEDFLSAVIDTGMWYDVANNIVDCDSKVTISFACEWEKRDDFVPLTVYPNNRWEYNGHFYQAVNKQVPFYVAKEAAEDVGGHLMTISSRDEEDIIGFLSINTDAIWLGASDHSVEGTWKWIDGTKWSYTNWKSGQPGNSNDDRDGSGEDFLCYSMEKTQWYDVADNYKDCGTDTIGYVIEWDSASKIRTAPKKTAPNGAVEYNGHYYKCFKLDTTWQSAKAICEAMGGYLWVCPTRQETDVVEIIDIHNLDVIYVGATDSVKEGTWKWINGEKWNKKEALWHGNEPGNADHDRDGSGEDYLEFEPKDSAWGWWDVANDYRDCGKRTGTTHYKVGFICEWDSIKDIRSDVYVFSDGAFQLSSGTATCLAPAVKDGKVTIPSTVKKGSKKYKVVKIDAKAMANKKNLTKVTIGENVTKIGGKAFYNCTNLKNITIKSRLLKESNVGSNAFKKINARGTITVPKGLKTAYTKWLLKRGVKSTVKIK